MEDREVVLEEDKKDRCYNFVMLRKYRIHRQVCDGELI